MTCDIPSFWQWTRQELLAGRWLTPDCEACRSQKESPTQEDFHCRYCTQYVQWSYRESGGIREWKRFHGESLATFSWSHLPPSQVALLRKYTEGFPQHLNTGWGLILTGGVGTGKTHLAVGFGLLALGLGYTVYATTLADLLHAMRMGWEAGNPRRQARLVERACDVHLLILDDLGMEKPTAWARERLSQVINRRYEANRTTIVTTNLNLDQLESMWDQRVASRLYGTCESIGLENVPDFRRLQRKQHLARRQVLRPVNGARRR